ncbi:hypothetical protein COOONC_15484 [Cooperia oncophora]
MAFVKATGDEFMSDPCAIDHVCAPNEAAEDKAKRIGYEKVRDMKDDPLCAGRVPRQVYEEMLTKASQEYDDDVISALYGWGFGMKRQAISRWPAASGLYAVVADGVHSKQPKELMQLHCVHGAVRWHAQEVRTGPEQSSHRSQWWDTIKGVIFLPRRLYPGITTKLCYNVANKVCFTSGPGLWSPPVPQDHVAYGACKDFLEYLHATWFDGPFEEMWNKWEKVDLRTTNIAEAYHNRLNVTFGRDHPDMRTLLEKLKYIDFEAKRTLRCLRETTFM